MPDEYILRIDCPDETGLVHKITGVLYHNQLNIIRNDEFVDKENGQFFMRTVFSGKTNPDKIMYGLQGILPNTARIYLTAKQVKNVVILVTKEHHCVSDLLIRHAFRELPMNIRAVIGNHQVLEPLAGQFGVPFHYISHEGISRETHEEQLAAVIQTYQPDYLILAKFMRVLTPGFTQRFPNKIINIHHSFLPAFIGANPYRQAYNRGVKIIGATAHFVNDNLDEGPIITQDVTHVNHSQSTAQMAMAGKDVEKLVLAKALKLVLEDRVFIYGNKTIIFE
ncbi:formyltetrahydrofolate deformylase [Rhodocytophaga aerolata]|uniref:Formyltetrahydrofolate deformylase n=1 Tax=Rhodocytophaga aerolata TaxID=455078 RepID=A0ABT8R7Z9_9BACT|nr:formyltetrahydrofolate deformylase [Rhodocytophaga aerolata]MDO1448222.1 formyltetrahydrofolate deformylase [Rhodocytophaga aerolata]